VEVNLKTNSVSTETESNCPVVPISKITRQHQGPVVKKVPFRNRSQNSPFRWELSVSCNAKRIILQNGPAIETELFLQQAPASLFQPNCKLVNFFGPPLTN